MSKQTNIQIRMDTQEKKEVEIILDQLGLSMSQAVKLFLRQVKLRSALPFSVELYRYNTETEEAMNEGRRIHHDENQASMTLKEFKQTYHK